jgi:hypothetical protein
MLLALGALAPGAWAQGPDPDVEIPEETTTSEAEIVGTDFLSYFLPDQHADAQLNGERPNFFVKGWTEQVSEDCGEWCSGLVMGVTKRNGLTKTLEMVARAPCDREFVVVKGRNRLSYEHFCVVGQNVFLQAERGYSQGARNAFRRFRFNAVSDARDANVGYVWVRANQGPGEHYTNRFHGDYFTSCGDVEPDPVFELTAPVFHGPYTLSNPEHRARLIAMMGDNADAAVADFQGLADEAGTPEKPVKILLRREFWGRYESGGICPNTREKWQCFSESEDYLVAKVGQVGLGRVGWQKRHAHEEGQPHHVQRRTLSTTIVWEKDSRIVPKNHCGLQPEE